VVHCDLKAANILSTKNGNIKLSDFGVSLNIKAVENIQQEALTASKAKVPLVRPVSEVAGTPNWSELPHIKSCCTGRSRMGRANTLGSLVAPEVITLNGASTASDIWSLGCTIIELLTGKPPYSEITNSMTGMLPRPGHSSSVKLIQKLAVLFRIVEDQMPPLPEGASGELVDFLRLCFIKDPKARPEAAVLSEHPWVKRLNPNMVSLRSYSQSSLLLAL
jgi:serine/threonine protein kinase